MTLQKHDFYPGNDATAEQLLKLAAEFHLAAVASKATGRRGQPLSRAPFRLLSIHAIELYLTAYLVKTGRSPSAVRGMQHDLIGRLDLAVNEGLVLTKGTSGHLGKLSSGREYLLSRYDVDQTRLTQLNRLEATLLEIANKVKAGLERT